MKRQLSIFLLLLSSAFGVPAQTAEAQKFDEFENTNCDDYLARMDNFLIELKSHVDAKGYIFIYEGNLKQLSYDKNGKYKGSKYVLPKVNMAKDLIDYFKDHLFFRGFLSQERIVFVEAGFREKFSVEMWFVPNEANLPKPMPTLTKIKQSKQKRSQFGFCGEM